MRRQLRKINKLLVSEDFQDLLGGKPKDLSTDELYKHLKENSVDYDDLKGIYKEAIAELSPTTAAKFKTQAIKEVKIEKESEIINSRYNRRSYRLSKKHKDSDSTDYDITQVGFRMLLKALRQFREHHKGGLPKLSSHNSIEGSVGENVIKTEQKENSKVKVKEIINSLSQQKVSKEEDKENDLSYNVPEFLLKDSPGQKEDLQSKKSENNQANKGKFFAEDSEAKATNYEQYLNVNHSPFKKINFQGGEREISNNSNLSQSFAYNNDDFAPFDNKNMNLSKPTEINFDTLHNMVPTTTNFVTNMFNKMVDVSGSTSKHVQINLNYTPNDTPSKNQPELCQKYDLNILSSALNLNINKDKKITIEVDEDGRLEIKTIPKPTSAK